MNRDGLCNQRDDRFSPERRGHLDKRFVAYALAAAGVAATTSPANAEISMAKCTTVGRE